MVISDVCEASTAPDMESETLEDRTAAWLQYLPRLLNLSASPLVLRSTEQFVISSCHRWRVPEKLSNPFNPRLLTRCFPLSNRTFVLASGGHARRSPATQRLDTVSLLRMRRSASVFSQLDPQRCPRHPEPRRSTCSVPLLSIERVEDHSPFFMRTDRCCIPRLP